MHGRYDEEVDSGEDQPVIIVSPPNKKTLGISSDVVRVHQKLKRKEKSWNRGEKIKVLKGACAGRRNNIYATIEYFLLDGFEGDAGGESRIICRSMDVPNENGCVLSVDDEHANLDLRSSLSLPLSVIDSGKLVPVESIEWNSRLHEKRQKSPAIIELLSWNHCQQLEVDGTLPINTPIFAGQVPPTHVVAVVRPINFMPGNTGKLDQKGIFQCNSEMTMEVKFKDEGQNSQDVILSERISPGACKGLDGLYFFPVGCKLPDLFHKAGAYMFSFSLIQYSSCQNCEKSVIVKPSTLKHVELRSPTLKNQLLPGYVFKEFVLEMFDAYGNHMSIGSEVTLSLSNFVIEDHVGTIRKVDAGGKIDLSGLLKLTAGFGENASLSVLLGDKVVFEQEFSIVRRKLRIASKLPDVCIAGSQLENLVFEVVDPDGVADMNIHHNDKDGQSHMLRIKSVSFQAQEFFQYAFEHGCCTVRAISIPLNEGTFCFSAAHSRYPELNITVEIPVANAPKAEFDDGQFPYLDTSMMQRQDLSSFNQDKNLAISFVNEDEELKDILKIGEEIGRIETFLLDLNNLKAKTEQEVLKLQEEGCPRQLSKVNGLFTKKELKERIQCMEDSAAAVICSLLPNQMPRKCIMGDIINLVALLGTVQSPELTRVLAEYLGEDKMLAVVCRTFDAASALERYTQSGEVDSTVALHAEAAALGKVICGRFLVLCVEDIRPYNGCCQGHDPQRKLTLPDPTLPNGSVPLGFLGYAVNMVELDDHHLQTRTAAGHGLRETVLFSLFRKLQVYETREYMMAARACLEDGAVSIDGGIIRENGLISLGYGNPSICFPLESPVLVTPETGERTAEIGELKEKLMNIEDDIGKVIQWHEKCLKKFHRRSRRYERILEESGPVTENQLLEYKPSTSVYSNIREQAL